MSRYTAIIKDGFFFVFLSFFNVFFPNNDDFQLEMKKIPKSAPESDSEALKEDWEQVGLYISDSIEKFKNEQISH